MSRKKEAVLIGILLAFAVLFYLKYVGEAKSRISEQLPSVCDTGESNRCFMEKAVKEGNQGFCSRINNSDDRDSCYYTLALNSNNQTLCEAILSANSRYRCLATIGKQAGLCDRIDDIKAKSSCYMTVAAKTLNVSLCHRIILENIRDKCIFDLTRRKPAPTECWTIINQTLKDMCIFEHVRMNLINPELCYHVKDPGLQGNCSSIRRIAINASSGTKGT